MTTKISSHMYFSMQSIQPKTEDWIKVSAKKGKWSSNSVINNEGQIIDARLKGGLKPTPLTRDLKWGVPVPIDSEEDPMKGKVLCEHIISFVQFQSLIRLQTFGSMPQLDTQV